MDGDNTMQNQTPDSGSAGGKSAMVWVVIIIIAAAAVFAFLRKSNKQVQDTDQDQNNQSMMGEDNNGQGMMENVPTGGMMDTKPTSTMMDGNGMMQGQVKTFTISAENFKFSPAEMRVKKGDKVKIVFNNKSGFHDFVLDEFNVRAKQANGPVTEEIQFVASKTGTFEFYCSVGQHRAMGMKGNLIVE